MDHVQQQYHVEDVGRILLQTQEQLRLMREQVAAATASSPSASTRYLGTPPPDARAFQDIIERAELEIRAKAELVLNGLVSASSQSVTPATALPAVTTSANASPKATRPRKSVASLMAARRGSRHETDEPDIDYFRARFHNTAIDVRASTTTAMPSPVQRITKGKLVKHRIAPHARLLPSVNKCDPSAPAPELSAHDAQSGMLSLVNRGFVPVGVDLTPAFVNSHGSSIMQHAKTRMYDRQEQPVRPAVPYTNPSGFNVAALKFDIAAAVAARDASSSTESVDKPSVTTSVGKSVSPTNAAAAVETRPRRPNVLTMRFQGDVARSAPNRSSPPSKQPPSQSPTRPEPSPETNDDDDATGGVIDATGDGTNDMDELRRNVDKVRGYNDLLDAYSLHQFLIHKGKALRATPEFVSFERVAHEVWGAVDEVIRALEELLTRYFVPLAYVDGPRVMALAAMELTVFSKRELLACVVNEDQVGALVRRPGQRYKGKDRKRRAATTIQKCVRMWRQQRLYRRCQHYAASVVAVQRRWRVFAAQSKLRRVLVARREQQLEQWRDSMLAFKQAWPRLRSARRVVIHVPSLSVDEHTRVGADSFAVQQNLQFAARLSAAADPNVDVVYVSPFELTTEVAQYALKLLELGGVADPAARVKLVFPEMALRLPAHWSLATLLLYSPHCLRRIRRFIRHRDAYLVMGVPGAEDRRLAIALGVPILGVDPGSDALPLLTKSGAKRFFVRADVNVPTGSYDIYDDDELVFALAKLVVAHTERDVWVLKLDYDPLGTGVAVLDVSTLAALREIRREQRSPEYWRQPGTRDHAARALVAELEQSIARLAVLLYPHAYATWRVFADAIAQVGVVVEAAASGAVVGRVRANLFVEPSGEVHVASTHDMVGMSPCTSTSTGSSGASSGSRETSVKATAATAAACSKKPIAFAFPQTAAPYEAIRGASTAIGRLMAQERVFGYASVDFLVFHDAATHAPRLWAMALHPYLTDSAATFATFHLLNRGSLNTNTGLYHLAASSSTTTAARGSAPSSSGMLATDLVLHEAMHSGLVSLERAGAPRTYVVSEYICHPSVSTMQYSAFFHTCRLHGVCFDVERCVGTVFLLADSLTAGVFGVLCSSESASGALGFLRMALEVIAREVGVHPVVDDFAGDGGAMGNFADVLGVVRALTGGKSAKLEKIRRLRKS